MSVPSKVGLTVVMITLMVLSMHMLAREDIDTNPRVYQSDLVGTWQHQWKEQRQELLFKSSGEYVLKDESGVEQFGTWRLDDWNLYLSGLERRRLVRIEGELNIVVFENNDIVFFPAFTKVESEH